MESFAERKIESVRANPIRLLPSPEVYIALSERIETEAHAAEEETRRLAHARAWELAKQQGVKPVQDINALHGDFWPEEESIDEFLSWLRSLRGNDQARSIPE